MLAGKNRIKSNLLVYCVFYIKGPACGVWGACGMEKRCGMNRRNGRDGKGCDLFTSDCFLFPNVKYADRLAYMPLDLLSNPRHMNTYAVTIKSLRQAGYLIYRQASTRLDCQHKRPQAAGLACSDFRCKFWPTLNELIISEGLSGSWYST